MVVAAPTDTCGACLFGVGGSGGSAVSVGPRDQPELGHHYDPAAVGRDGHTTSVSGGLAQQPDQAAPGHHYPAHRHRHQSGAPFRSHHFMDVCCVGRC